MEKERNLEITPAEDINNGHPTDPRTPSKCPYTIKKRHKIH